MNFDYPYSLTFIGLLLHFFLRFALICYTHANPICLEFLFGSFCLGICGVGGCMSCKVDSPIFYITWVVNRAFLMGHPSEGFLPHEKCSVSPNCELIIGYITLLHFQAIRVLNFVLLKVLYSTEFIAVIFYF